MSVGWSLHTPARSHPEALDQGSLPDLEPLDAGLAAAAHAALRYADETKKACAILIQGPGLRGGTADIVHYAQVPAGNRPGAA